MYFNEFDLVVNYLSLQKGYIINWDLPQTLWYVWKYLGQQQMAWFSVTPKQPETREPSLSDHVFPRRRFFSPQNVSLTQPLSCFFFQSLSSVWLQENATDPLPRPFQRERRDKVGPHCVCVCPVKSSEEVFCS